MFEIQGERYKAKGERDCFLPLPCTLHLAPFAFRLLPFALNPKPALK